MKKLKDGGMKPMIDIFIPSYHRADNLKTVNYFKKIGWDVKNIHVLIDSEADDRNEYQYLADKVGFNLFVFDMYEARKNKHREIKRI